jgi:hypothetical protein
MSRLAFLMSGVGAAVVVALLFRMNLLTPALEGLVEERLLPRSNMTSWMIPRFEAMLNMSDSVVKEYTM